MIDFSGHRQAAGPVDSRRLIVYQTNTILAPIVAGPARALGGFSALVPQISLPGADAIFLAGVAPGGVYFFITVVRF